MYGPWHDSDQASLRNARWATRQDKVAEESGSRGERIKSEGHDEGDRGNTSTPPAMSDRPSA